MWEGLGGEVICTDEALVMLTPADRELLVALANAREQIAAALALVAAVDAYEDAVECCDCDPSDWRCGHAVKTKHDAKMTALAAYRASTAPGEVAE